MAAAAAASSGTRGTSTDAFREALSAYVVDLRESGLGPVDALLAVEVTLRDVPPSLLEQWVTWCIEAYYRAA